MLGLERAHIFSYVLYPNSFFATSSHLSLNSSEKTNKLSQPTDKSPTKTCFRIWWLPLKAMLSSSCVSYHVEHHRNRKYLLTYLLHRIEPAARRRVHDDGDSNLLVVRTIRPFSDQSKTMFLSSPLDLQLATYLASAMLWGATSSSSSSNITTNMMTLHSTLSMLWGVYVLKFGLSKFPS